jgi:predicted lipoprotein with Yx(FWY)xxD motif
MRISRPPRARQRARAGARTVIAGAVIFVLIVASSAFGARAYGSARKAGGTRHAGVRATAASGPTRLGTAVKGKLGRILVNASGQTLYLFTRDSRGTSTCSGTCQGTWIPVLAGSVAAERGSGLSAKLVGTITRSGGDRQATYNRHPLYRFAREKTTKTTTGEGADQFGGYWYVVNVKGNEVKPKNSSPCNPVCGGY